MSITTLQGDCRDVLKTLAPGSIQCCVTSPPYYGLRKYGDDPREIGQERTPAEYVSALVAVFREVKRVLRDDGTLWLNLGDSYSSDQKGSGGLTEKQSTNRGSFFEPRRIRTDLLNFLESGIEGGRIFLRGRSALAIAAESQNILAHNKPLPYSKLFRLFGVQRVFFKQGDDDFCEVFNLLDAEASVWVGSSVAFSRVGVTGSDLVVYVADNVRVVIADDDLNGQSALSVPVFQEPTKDANMPLTIEETAEPIAERIGDIEPTGNIITLNTPSESLLQIDLVDDLVAAGKSLFTATKGLRDFRVTKASQEHFALTMLQGRLNLAIGCVGHVFVSNQYGSLIRYPELYDKAERQSNRMQPKQLIGIPWMVAMALQEDGWILRSDCIWAKPNAMPESVRDRPTRAHEYLFLLSKSPRYFYDADAIAEPVSAKTEWTYPQPDKAARAGITSNGTGASSLRTQPADGTRNRRTVWTISTRPYQEAHYAVFPEALIEPCILAGSLPTGAPEPDEFVYTPTGQGERLPDPSVETGRAGFNRPRRDTEGVRPMTRREQAAYAEQLKTSPYREHMEQEVGATTFAHYLRTDTSGARSIPPLLLDAWIDRGWLTSVNLPPRVVDISRSTVLDPFAGSGTTGRVALRLQRRAILIELSLEYVEEHIAKRTDGVQIEMFC